jgi:hypothetical protein
MTTPTLDSLVKTVLEDCAEYDGETDYTIVKSFVADAMPKLATVLFAMVAEDNTLAWLKLQDQAPDPFTALSWAIGDEVLRRCEEELEKTR